MKSNCGCKQACGCGDVVLTTPPSCPVRCTNGDPCPETFDAKCLVYMGDTIANLGITTGMRFDDVLQILAMAIVNPGCIYPSAPCQGAVGFKSTLISATTISLKWLPVSNALSYQVEYRATTSPTWIVNPAVTAPTVVDSIGGLTPNTAYYVRVKTTCLSGNCYSLVLTIKTTS